MENAQEAVKVLEKHGLHVEGLRGPQGWRYQIKSRSGLEYQISNDEILQLQADNKLDWNGVITIANPPRE